MSLGHTVKVGTSLLEGEIDFLFASTNGHPVALKPVKRKVEFLVPGFEKRYSLGWSWPGFWVGATPGAPDQQQN
jgi:hypothetical protein